MFMRVSRLMLVTLRDAPADAEIISHQLLIRGGYIRRVAGGIYAYMPLMWKVLQKITSIVQEEMDNKGCLQALLPQLHPSDLWKRSGRWEGYTDGEGIMFSLKDRQKKELGLGPTHEEVITTIAGEILQSYKQLPVNIYQIQTKFRDEIRPRFGLMRSREFIMKDAYSFHANEESLKSTYSEMNDAYKKIFSRSGLKTVAVEADSGAIGGAASQEFMVTASSGEDLILTSSDGIYAANQEKAVSLASDSVIIKDNEQHLIDTPNQNTIEELCLKQGFHSSQIVKVLLMIARLENNEKQPVLISIRGDQEVNEVKLVNILNQCLNKNILDILPITNEHLDKEGLETIPFGSIGPDLSDNVLNNAISWNKNFFRITDITAANLAIFICGANKEYKHKCYTKWSDLKIKPIPFDVRKAKAGERCIHDNKQTLIECRGIEIGHIFQLGKKYSKALDSEFTNEHGQKENFWMGCYGIGVSRLAQAAIEQNHDEDGIIWPLAIAPFEVIIVIANMKDPIQQKLGEKIYRELILKGIDVLLDDRNERAGVKFKDADLIGIPWRLVVGREAAEGNIEIRDRSSKETTVLNIDDAQEKIYQNIFERRSLFSPSSF